jgi:hypothetical protein
LKRLAGDRRVSLALEAPLDMGFALGALAPVLKAWKLKTGGEGLRCPPLRSEGAQVDEGTRGAALREVLEQLRLQRPEPGWHECTRHTFASQWAMAGRSIEELEESLGHCSVVMTERYAHLRPDLFAEGAYAALKVDLTSGGDLRQMENGQPSASTPGSAPGSYRNHQQEAGAAL